MIDWLIGESSCSQSLPFPRFPQWNNLLISPFELDIAYSTRIGIVATIPYVLSNTAAHIARKIRGFFQFWKLLFMGKVDEFLAPCVHI